MAKTTKQQPVCDWCEKKITSFWNRQPILIGKHSGKNFHVKLFVKDPNNCFSRWLESGKSGTKASNERKLAKVKRKVKRKLTSRLKKSENKENVKVISEEQKEYDEAYKIKMAYKKSLEKSEELHEKAIKEIKGKIKAKCEVCDKRFDPSELYEVTSIDGWKDCIKFLHKEGDTITCSDECIDVFEEIKKIKESERQSKIRSKAEKRLYGKVKTKKKRVPLSKALRDRVYRKYENQCMICSQKQGLHIHHKDHDPKNNAMRNLLLLCGVCHKKIHMKVR